MLSRIPPSPTIDKNTLAELTAWAKIQFEHHKDGIYCQEENGLFYKMEASLSPVLKKRHNGKDYLIRAAAAFGETYIYIEEA